MSSRRRLPLVTLLLAVTALAGCQTQPCIVIADLPADSILSLPTSPPATAEPPAPPSKAPPGEFPASWVPSAYARPWRWIVIHHSASDAGSAEIFDRWHRARGWDELGYHFVITNGQGGEDGLVQVGSRWVKQKWGAHCGGTPNNDYNNHGIGICLVGDFCDKLPSPAQLQALRKLVIFLADRYGIGGSCVIGHCDAPNSSTACPGAELHRHLNDELRPALRRRSAVAGR